MLALTVFAKPEARDFVQIYVPNALALIVRLLNSASSAQLVGDSPKQSDQRSRRNMRGIYQFYCLLHHHWLFQSPHPKFIGQPVVP